MESKFKVGDEVRVIENLGADNIAIGTTHVLTKIDGIRHYIGDTVFSERCFELVTPEPEAQPTDPALVTYTVTVPRKMFPFAPGSEVIVREHNRNSWVKDIFIVKLEGTIYPFTCVKTMYKECHPLATHGHLLGTTYPADTPSCAKCGKAVLRNDSGKPKFMLYEEEVCEKCFAGEEAFAQHPTATTADGVTQPQFQPFQRVLVRDTDCAQWQACIYSHYSGGVFYCHCASGQWWNYCIPYEGNEHLLGTTDAPTEEEQRYD